MCIGTPKIPPVKQFQASKAPVFRDSAATPSTGRRGTILTGGSGVVDASPTQKKTLLGQ